MIPAWRMASFAALIWSSGTGCLAKKEDGSAVDEEGCTVVRGTAKVTEVRMASPPSWTTASGSGTVLGVSPVDFFLILLSLRGTSSSSSSGRLMTCGGAARKVQSTGEKYSRPEL